jgi:hypothetical protein
MVLEISGLLREDVTRNGEKYILSCFINYNHRLDNNVKEDKMGEACSIHGNEESKPI